MTALVSRRRRTALGLAAAALAMAAAMDAVSPTPLHASPVMTASLQARDISTGLPLPQAGGVYQVGLGQQFTVALLIDLTGPNFSDGFHGTIGSNMPLGVQSTDVHVLSGGTVGAVVPVAVPGSPPTWSGYADLTPDGIGFGSVELIDLDADGDLDASSLGFSEHVRFLPVNATAAQLQREQYGVTASIPGVTPLVAGPLAVTSGTYLAQNAGLAALSTQITVSNVFIDPPSSAGDSATAKGALLEITADQVNSSIQINVVPEPATAAVAGFGLIGVLAARRRRGRAGAARGERGHLFEPMTNHVRGTLS